MFVDIETFLSFPRRFWVWRFPRGLFDVVFIVCINQETKALSENFHPVDLMFELVDIRLVTNLPSHDLLSEQVADRSLKPLQHLSNKISIIAQRTERYEGGDCRPVRNMNRMVNNPLNICQTYKQLLLVPRIRVVHSISMLKELLSQ